MSLTYSPPIPHRTTNGKNSFFALSTASTWNERTTGGAGLVKSSPTCVAVIVHVPTFRNVIRLPLIEQIAGVSLVSVTVNPEEAVALIGNELSLSRWSAMAAK